MIHGVCKVCSPKLETLKSGKEKGLELLDEMNGHPPIFGYQELGYEIIAF